MAGPVASIGEVPLPDVLPSEYVATLDELQRLGRALDAHRAAVTRTGWWWYPEHRQRPPEPAGSAYVLLFDTTIALFNSGHDWLELTLDVAWRSHLTVNAAVEVGCWCPQDHNMHQVRSETWSVTGSQDLVRGFAAGIAVLTNVLDSGSFNPSVWRAEAGLPDTPPPRQ